MNTLEPYTIDTPFGEIDKCSKFVIDDVLTPFTLHDVMEYGQQYTLGLWIKTDSDGEEEDDEEITDMSILVRGANMPVGGKWTRYTHTFPAYNQDLKIYFNNVGTYYIYRPQLERGIVATDWSESPLDTEKKIENAQDAANTAKAGVEELYIKLEDSIQMLVAGINSGSMLELTEDGLVFASGGTKDQLLEIRDMLDKLDRTTNDSINQLKSSIEESGNLSSYVDIGQLENNDPYLELGTADPDTGKLGEFRVRITPSAIEFMQWDQAIAWISNQELHIRKAVIEDELTVGGFVLKQHGSRNNVGFLWKGVTS